MFLQYLWGIETKFWTMKDSSFIKVFTVPMRNWNTLPFCKSESIAPCFYSTYEELKQRRRDKIWRRHKGFYSTYEELKPFPICLVQVNSWSFYSTYEELKPPRERPLSVLMIAFLQYLWGIETRSDNMAGTGKEFVFTVPMRNWNYGSYKQKK